MGLRKTLRKTIDYIYNYANNYSLIKNKNIRIRGLISAVNKENIEVKGRLYINHFCHINAMGGVEFGDNVNLSSGCKIISTGLMANG